MNSWTKLLLLSSICIAVITFTDCAVSAISTHCTIDESKKTKPAKLKPNLWRIIMKTKIAKLTTTAAIIIAVLIGINHLGGSIDGTNVAWGQEIMTAIETIKGVSCREQIFTVTQDGSKHLSSTWNVLYYSKDSYRRDIYDGDTLREIQCEVSAKATVEVSVKATPAIVYGLHQKNSSLCPQTPQLR